MTTPLRIQASFSHCHLLDPDATVAEGDMGPRALPYSWQIGNGIAATWDLTKEIEGAQISNIQAVFIDNSLNSSPVTLVSSEIPGMSITVKSNSQGTYPFFGKTFSTLNLSTPNAATVTVNVILLNTPQPYAQWASL